MTGITKRWKAIDVAGQILMFLLPLGYIASNPQSIEDGTILTPFFSLGGWQLISFFVHIAHRNAPWISRARKVYSYLLISIGISTLAALAVNQLAFGLLCCMLFLGPLMGALYLIISFTEWRRSARMMVRGRQAL